ncbi:hypothetical protein EBT25_05190 [bacterium]|jgi:hypothetical protein|nr:hypothetical protein [bacterium]
MEWLSDKMDWLIFICFIIPGTLLIAGMIYAGTRVSKMNEECTKRNGVLVKSVDGYICIDKGSLK